MRTFSSGATRDNDDNKLDFEGFLSPFALEAYAQYMHGHRIQADGNLRESDNWQKGIPVDQYMKSLWRHFFAVWKGHRQGEIDRQDVCAMLFNGMGILHEIVAPTRQDSRKLDESERILDESSSAAISNRRSAQQAIQRFYDSLQKKMPFKDPPPVRAFRAVEWAMIAVLGAAILSSWALAFLYSKIIS